MFATQAETHYTVKITIIDHLGEHDGGTVDIHKSRACLNCAHDGDRDSDWIAEGATKTWGRCMNACSAANAENEADQWCFDHQTAAESEANIHRPHVPVLTVLQGGAA